MFGSGSITDGNLLCEWSPFLYPACLLPLECLREVYYIGPLLFLVFINILPDSVNASSSQCTFLLMIPNAPRYTLSIDVNKLQHADINDNHIASWSKSWSLPFNDIVIQFCSSPPPQTSYTLAGLNITQLMSNKDLELIFQSDPKSLLKLIIIYTRNYRTAQKNFFYHQIRLKLKSNFIFLSTVVYGSLLWRLMLIKDILSGSRKNSEESNKVHSWLRSITLTYKERLISKNRTPRYNILDYVTPTTGFTPDPWTIIITRTHVRTLFIIIVSQDYGIACHQLT